MPPSTRCGARSPEVFRESPGMPMKRGAPRRVPAMADPESSPKIALERRQALRVPVRRLVRVVHGLRSFAAELVDLSVGGCRLRCPMPVTAHGSLWIVLPAGFGGRLPLLLRGEVARAESVRGAPTGVCEVALRFREPSLRASGRLQAALAQVLAPHGSRSRVLLGRELSSAGMRVENAVGLRAGEELRLALHAPAGGTTPLVLTSRVVRCDEQGETRLAFEGSGPRELAWLSQLASADLPVVAEIL